MYALPLFLRRGPSFHQLHTYPFQESSCFVVHCLCCYKLLLVERCCRPFMSLQLCLVQRIFLVLIDRVVEAYFPLLLLTIIVYHFLKRLNSRVSGRRCRSFWVDLRFTHVFLSLCLTRKQRRDCFWQHHIVLIPFADENLMQR